MNCRLQNLHVPNVAWLVTASALVAGCAGVPDTSRYVAPPQGSTWVSSIRNFGSFGAGTQQVTRTMGMQAWQGRNLLAYKADPVTILAEDDGCWVAWVSGTTPVFTWDPPVCFNRPLVVGDAYIKKFRVTVHQTKQTLDVEARWKVEAYEEVSLPAGTFAAYKITYSDNTGTERIDWISPELASIFVKSTVKRTASHRLGAGTQEMELVSQTIRR